MNINSYRLRTALEKLVKDSRGQGVTLGGRGKTLKKTTIVKLSSYYKSAIYANQNNVSEMKKAILASLYHSVSTDKNPKHMYCPVGSGSWCFFQKAIANKKTPGAHDKNVGTPLKEEYLKKLLPIYQRLSSDDLLKRCLGCKTQNSNESLHSMIWQRCSKEKFVGKDTVEVAANLAICEFNFGARESLSMITSNLRIGFEKLCNERSRLRDLERLKRNDLKSTIEYKKTRKRKAIMETKFSDKKTSKKDYKAGSF